MFFTRKRTLMQSATPVLTDCDIVKACVGIYFYADQAPVTFEHFENPSPDNGGICWGLIRLPNDTFLVVFRGSTTFEDYMRDLNCFARPWHHTYLGPIHPGFYEGLETVWRLIKAMCGKRIIFSGHSLGAGRATQITGLAIQDGYTDIERVVIGEPQSGFRKLYDIVDKIPYRVYFNTDGHFSDIVPSIPPYVWPEKYVNENAFTKICAPPDLKIMLEWSIACWHYSPLYLKGVRHLLGWDDTAEHII
jgi:hypothetical protein